MSQEFTTFMEYLKKLQDRYFFMLSAFYTREALEELRAPNIVGKEEAQKNIETMNKYNNFFSLSKESLRVYFLLELAKLFDVSNESLHINKMVNFTESNIQKLSVNDFLEFNQDRKFIKEMIESYKGINNKDLKHIKLLISKHSATIQNIKIYRDKYLAHDDVTKTSVVLTPKMIKPLFEIIEKILNLFSLKVDHSTTMYNYVEKECKNDTKSVVNYLKRFELHRLKEIEEKHKN